MLAPNPVKTFFGHAQCNNHIDMITVVFLVWVFECSQHLGAFGGVAVIDQVRHFEDVTCCGFDQVKAGHVVNTLPFTQPVHDFIHFTLFVFQTFAGVDVGNMHDGLERWIKHFTNRIDIRTGIKKIADFQRFEPAIAVELFVVGIRDGVEFGFISL